MTTNQATSADEDPISYIDCSEDCIPNDLSNEMEYGEIKDSRNDEIEDDIPNDLSDNKFNAILPSPTKSTTVVIEVGMKFSEQKDILDLYTTFGKANGFGIRKRTSNENYVMLTCVREGYHQPRKGKDVCELCATKPRWTSSSRMGCEACLKASREKKTKMWKITYFIDKHNHEMVTPKSVSYLRSHRKMPDAAKCLIEEFNNAGLPTGKVATIFKSHDLGFDSRDCYNHMKNVRRRSLLLGCALLHDETEDSFVWLFEEWLRAMNGKHPVAIITDQDLAISNAVSKVFPNTKHRFCLWHIMKKFPEKLSHLYHDHASFKRHLNDCIWSFKSTQEFEDRWQRFLIQYGLIENEWLNVLYIIRSSWVPIFNHSTFFAGMNTTPRSESINSFFDGFVTSGTTLKEFVEKYNQAIDARYESFKKEDFESRHKERILTFNMPLEEHAAKVYTRAIFSKFCDQLSLSLRFSKEKLGDDCEWVIYRVFNRKDVEDYATVEMKLENREARCSCHYFQFMGILCRHMLAIFLIENVEQIPEHFILQRWSKEGNVIPSGEKDKCTANGDRLLRSFHLRSRYSKLDDLAYKSDEAFKLICDGIDSLYKAAEKVLACEESSGLGDSNLQLLSFHHEEPSMMYLKDPNISQTKGRKRDSESTSQGHRIRSGIEEASKHTNICGNWVIFGNCSSTYSKSGVFSSSHITHQLGERSNMFTNWQATSDVLS
ncbi:protein FAR1-RELATED SEQUENCE 5-like [Gastrolobium bilobum]|uniref:protein FAR1-RELATED SEQUENCE 5-like n=1 Tax=Gastrolobium bilobum TaxID=150636 RepID=UPI002AB25746|nr:protein FAR1-RELATED SEQUENCE 5-like [Gastrolobium bilobum]